MDFLGSGMPFGGPQYAAYAAQQAQVGAMDFLGSGMPFGGPQYAAYAAQQACLLPRPAAPQQHHPLQQQPRPLYPDVQAQPPLPQSQQRGAAPSSQGVPGWGKGGGGGGGGRDDGLAGWDGAGRLGGGGGGPGGAPFGNAGRGSGGGRMGGWDGAGRLGGGGGGGGAPFGNAGRGSGGRGGGVPGVGGAMRGPAKGDLGNGLMGGMGKGSRAGRGGGGGGLGFDGGPGMGGGGLKGGGGGGGGGKFGGKKGGGGKGGKFGGGGGRFAGGDGGFMGKGGPGFMGGLGPAPMSGGENEDGEEVEWAEYSMGAGPVYEAEELWEDTQDVHEEVHVFGPHGQIIAPAFRTFADCTQAFPPMLVEALVSAGFSAPTAIQAHTWPVASLGQDVIGVAKTGSGKTLAFLLPGFVRTRMREAPPPNLLVLAPTRELAMQIEAESEKFGGPSGFRAACCYGGAPRGPQLAALRAGAQVVVACPGRLNDFIEGGQVRLNNCTYVVLDEADRMLDMGFEPQIRKILLQTPKERQTLLFTATWPSQVRSLASEFLVRPVHVQIGKSDPLTTNSDIGQHVIMVNSEEEKHQRLLELVAQHAGERVLVFCETKRATEGLARSLQGPPHRVAAARIHGDMEQHERKASLEAFRAAKANVLIATDLAARGLDVKGIAVVVNYDAAWTAKEYVHRIGRTGRAGEKGTAYSLLMPDDGPRARELVQVLQRSDVPVPPELAHLSTQRGRPRGGGKPGNRSGDAAGGGGWGRSRWSEGSGPNLPRTKLSPDIVLGEVVEWKGKFGWIRPLEPVHHPLSNKHNGRIYISVTDLIGSGRLDTGQQVQFKIYADSSGLGAEECSPC